MYSSECRYLAHYGIDLGKQVAKKEGAASAPAPAEAKKSRSVLKKAVAVKARGESRVIDKVTSTCMHRTALCDCMCLPFFFLVSLDFCFCCSCFILALALVADRTAFPHRNMQN